jgi:hypothetical protein
MILQDAISDDEDKEDEEVQRRVYKLLSMIIHSQEGLGITAMALLGSFDIDALRLDLMSLSSVVSSTNYLRFYHSSFSGYVSSNWCKYPILQDDGHTALANGCLRVITTDLRKRNICQLDDRICLNDDVADLNGRIDTFIPSGLRYACVHLMPHLLYAEAPFDPSVRHGLETFCRGHVLRWIEALSLLRSISVTMADLHRVALRMEVRYSEWD